MVNIILSTILYSVLIIIRQVSSQFEEWDGTTQIYDPPPAHRPEEWLHDPNYNPAFIKNHKAKDINLYFEHYNSYYAVDYIDDKEEKRSAEAFKSNIHWIMKLNEMMPSVVFSINEFTRFSLDDIINNFTGFNPDGIDDSYMISYEDMNKTRERPTNLDFTPKVGGHWAKHQGDCKGSYLFAAVGTVELQLYYRFQYAPILSIQQAYNCDVNKKASCKNGGLPHLVLDGLHNAGSVSGEYYTSEYMVENITKAKGWCISPNPIGIVDNVIRLKVKNEDDLVSALLDYGPMTTAISLSNSIQHYHKGVLDPFDCVGNPVQAVIIAGYGVTNDNVPYWLIKNSWGVNWGEFGFMRLIRGIGACGIGSYLVTVTVQDLHNSKDNGYVTKKDEIDKYKAFKEKIAEEKRKIAEEQKRIEEEQKNIKDEKKKIEDQKNITENESSTKLK